MAIRFVRPETITIPLDGGDTITIRKQLTAGERRDMYARMYFPDSTKVDPMRVHRAGITAYLLDWTGKDGDGRAVPIAGLPIADLETVVDSLDSESFMELVEAINKATTDAADAAEKNEPAAAGANRVVSDLAVCRIMGWRYDWLLELDADVYDVLIAELSRTKDDG